MAPHIKVCLQEKEGLDSVPLEHEEVICNVSLAREESLAELAKTTADQALRCGTRVAKERAENVKREYEKT